MSNVSFESLLNRKSDEIEKPSPLPIGTYLWVIPALPKMDVVAKSGTKGVEYTVKCVAPQSDVDQDALRAYIDKHGSPAGREMRLTFWVTPDSIFRWKEFLEDHLGIDPAGRTIGQYHNDAVNRSFLGTIKHAPSQDGTMLYANIDKTARAS